MDTYITISQAAHIMEENQLIKLVSLGKIRSSQLKGGEMLVNEQDLIDRLQITARPEYSQYSHLAGCQIGISEAARKYAIPQQTVSRWVAKGFISKLGQDGRKTLIDESHIATRAAIYHQAGGSQGKWVYAPDGGIYSKKH